MSMTCARRRAARAAARGTRSAGWAWRHGSETSGDSAGGPVVLQVQQEGVGRALAADRRLLAVAGQHDDVVGAAAAPCRAGCAASSGGRRRAGRCGRSSRRTAGRRRTSPRRRPRASYGVRKVTEPAVWPGVWSTTNRSPASSSSWRVGQLPDVVGLGELVVAAEQHLAGLAGHAGHRVGSRCRSPGWIHAVASYVPATGATHHMWSTWPWVTSTATGLSRCSRTTSATPVGGVLAGVDDDALAARGRWPRRSSSCPTDPRGSRRSAPRQHYRARRAAGVASVLDPGGRAAAARGVTSMGTGRPAWDGVRGSADVERRASCERSAPVTSHQWGRVDDDGTVYVRTADGERSVGQYPEGSPEEALALLHRAVRRARRSRSSCSSSGSSPA